MNISRLAFSVVFGAAMCGFAVAQNHGSSGSHESHSSGGGSHSDGGSHFSGGSRTSGGGGYHSYHSSTNSSGYHGGGGSYSFGNHQFQGWGSASSVATTHQYWNGSPNAGTRSFNGVNHSVFNRAGSFSSGGHTDINHFNVSVADAGQHGRYEPTGHSRYEGTHNLNGGYHTMASHGPVQLVQKGQGFSFGNQPYHFGNGGQGGNHNWRDGYRQYHHDWDDSHFFFGFYLFSPWAEPCVVSPWYDYPCLPPYLPAERVIYVNDNANWYGGSDYPFNVDADPNSYGNVDLNYALNELVNVFANGDEYGLGELVDRNSEVGVYNDGKYMYSVKGDDFYQMMLDNVHGVQNVNFSISRVRLTQTGAIVNARHEFTDPDGGNDVVYQEYRLNNADGHFVVQDFNTSKSPSGARTFF